MDWFLLVSGYEGCGKSNLGLQICKIIDPKFDISRVCFESQEFQQLVATLPKYSAILADEGSSLLFSRDSMRGDNKEVIRTLTQCRFRNLFVCVCIPNPFLIDSYIRSHRMRTLIKIIRRGLIAFYSRRRIQQMKRDSQTKIIKWSRPNFYDTTPHLTDDLWEAYQKKKEEYRKPVVNPKLEAIKERERKLRENTMTVTQAHEIYGLSASRLRQLVEEGQVSAIKHRDRWFINIDSIENWIQSKRIIKIVD